MTEPHAPYVTHAPGDPTRRRKRTKLRLRFRVLERDNWRCHWCGTPARETKLVIDHLYPFSQGGADEAANYVASCPACNGGKGDVILEGLTA
jgi:5-methylcytosine-specific restriction protein A